MVKIRPFRLMLWSLLVFTAGGALIVYGVRVRDSNRVTYAQMIEGMADMSQSRASQDNPPVLEIWDMGWVIMCIGIVVAVPGVVLMVGSGASMVYRKYVPEKEYVGINHDEKDNDDDTTDSDDGDSQGDDVGEELLHAHAAREDKSHVLTMASDRQSPEAIEPVDLAEPDHADQVKPETPLPVNQFTADPHRVEKPVIELQEEPQGGELTSQDENSKGADIYEVHEDNPSLKPPEHDERA